MLPDRVSNPGPLTYESGSYRLCYAARLICVPVRRDNPRALARGLSTAQVHKPFSHLYHIQCRPCTFCAKDWVPVDCSTNCDDKNKFFKEEIEMLNILKKQKVSQNIDNSHC